MSTLTGIVISSSSVYVFESCHLMFCECEFSVCNDKNWTIVDSPFYVLCLALLSIVQRSWSAQEARMLHHLSSKCAHEMLVDHFHNTGTLINHYPKLCSKQCKERKCQANAHTALDFSCIFNIWANSPWLLSTFAKPFNFPLSPSVPIDDFEIQKNIDYQIDIQKKLII